MEPRGHFPLVLARSEVSDDNLGDISSGVESGGEGRTSMLPSFQDRAGISMDPEKARATEFFLFEKDALETSGNIKREIRNDVFVAL